jgi:hypothetical protein
VISGVGVGDGVGTPVGVGDGVGMPVGVGVGLGSGGGPPTSGGLAVGRGVAPPGVAAPGVAPPAGGEAVGDEDGSGDALVSGRKISAAFGSKGRSASAAFSTTPPREIASTARLRPSGTKRAATASPRTTAPKIAAFRHANHEECSSGSNGRPARDPRSALTAGETPVAARCAVDTG